MQSDSSAHRPNAPPAVWNYSALHVAEQLRAQTSTEPDCTSSSRHSSRVLVLCNANKA